MGFLVTGRFLPGIRTMTRDAVAISQDIQEKWRSPEIREHGIGGIKSRLEPDGYTS